MWVPTFAFKHLDEQPNEITKAEAPEEYQGVSSCKKLGNVGLQAPHGARRGFSSPWGLTRTVGEVDSLTPDFSPLQGESSTSRGRSIFRGKRKVVAGMEGNAKCILPGKAHIMHNISVSLTAMFDTPQTHQFWVFAPGWYIMLVTKRKNRFISHAKTRFEYYWITESSLLCITLFFPLMYSVRSLLEIYRLHAVIKDFFNRHFPVSVVIWTVFCKNSTENFQKRLVLPDWFNPCFLYLHF